MDRNKVLDRMAELMKPIDEAIMNCDDDQEILMLASVMLSTAKTMYTAVLGEKAAFSVIKSLVTEN